MPLLDCPHINLKAIIEPVAKKHGKNYFQAYDALRRRSGFTETLCRELTSNMKQLALEIEEHVKVSKAEDKNYPFNGNGS